MSIGVISSIITGVLQPLNTLLFGNLTGSIIDYVQVISDATTDAAARDAAADKFIGEISDFAIYNTLIGAGMLIFSYISTETFNFASLKQVYSRKN